METASRIPHSRRRVKNKSRPKNNGTTHTKASLCALPEEVLLHLLGKLHIKQLLSVCSTNAYFHDLINNNTSVWCNVSFHGTWPTVPNMAHFTKAAEHGNIEALVKLGVAFLYNEGLPGDFEGQKITTNGERAAEMFCKVESFTPQISPFTWLFIRPPWAIAGACCKECVFTNMKEYVTKMADPSVYICIAKTMGILSLDDYKVDIEQNLTKAKLLGSQEAAFLLWTQKYCQCCRELDSGADLQSLRELREIALSGFYEGQLVLGKRYITGKYGGISRHQAATFVRGFVQSSQPTNVKSIYRFNELTHSMRYILMDWLVEVACMKDFTSLTLHMAISVVDRFLQRYKTTRAKLQLLGVAAMVLCSRFLGLEIITIREAAWLTDNTYKYEDVVRMMGEITATLQGKFRVPVSLDYVDLLNSTVNSDSEAVYLSEYFCELALLQSDLGDFPMGEVAASCVLFSRLVQNAENPWSADMVEFTGYTVKHLQKCLLVMHDKCFVEQAMVDHRDVVLQAIKDRYADEEYMAVSNRPILSKSELRNHLNMPEETVPCAAPTVGRSSLDLIASPCRGSTGRISVSMDNCSPMKTDREQAATPTMEAMQRANKLNESSISGYDGDLEDEGESCMEEVDSECESDRVWLMNKLRWSSSLRSRTRSEHSESDTGSSHGGCSKINSSIVTTQNSQTSRMSMLSIGAEASHKTCDKLDTVPEVPREEFSMHQDCMRHVSATLTQEVTAYGLTKSSTVSHEDPSLGSNSAVDSGIDIISPTPGLCMQSVPCSKTLKSSTTFKASAALDLDRMSSSLLSSTATVGSLGLRSVSSKFNIVLSTDPVRKRRLSESASSSQNKIHIISS